MHEMSESGEICEPDPHMRAWHNGRFKAFEMMQQLDGDIRATVGSLKKQPVVSEAMTLPTRDL